MNLIDKYMLKITNTLTFSQEAGEIISDIRELIDVNLDGDCSIENVKKVLNELGDPRELALSYLDQSGAFIDTEWVPYYYRGLKTSYKISMIIVLIIHMILTLVSISNNNNVFISIIKPLPLYIVVASFVFTIVTLIFFIMSKTITVEEYLTDSSKQSFRKVVVGDDSSLTSSRNKDGRSIKMGASWDVSELNTYKYDADYQSLYKAKSVKFNIILQVIFAVIWSFIIIRQHFLPKTDVNLIVDKYIPLLIFYIILMTTLNILITLRGKLGYDLYKKDILVLSVIRSFIRVTLLFMILIVFKVFDLTDLLSHTNGFNINSEQFFMGVYAIIVIAQVVAMIYYIVGYCKNK